MKVAILGAGGLRTPLLIRGLAESRLPIGEIGLFDTDAARLDQMAAIAGAMTSGLRLRVLDNAPDAVKDSQFVFTSIRAGGMEARAADERACLERGILGQETVGPCGFALASRNVRPMLDYAASVELHAPEAFLLNFTNPVGIITQAITERLEDGLESRTIGICDTPAELFSSAAHALDLDPEQPRFDYFGLNHLGWLREIWLDGEPQMPRLWREPHRLESVYRTKLFDIEFLKESELLPSEYLYYYYRPDVAAANLKRSGRTRGEVILEQNQSFFQKLSQSSDLVAGYASYLSQRESGYFRLESASDELSPPQQSRLTGYDRIAIAISEAIHFDTGEVLPVNVNNQGRFEGLRDSDVVELCCPLGKGGAATTPQRSIPDAPFRLIRSVKAYERQAILASETRKRSDQIEAIRLNPLVKDEAQAVELVDALRLG